MQPRPGRHGHGAVLVVVGHVRGGRDGPGGRVGEGELGAVAARPAAGTGRAWRRVVVEAAVGPEPHQHRHGRLGEVQGQLGGVVAGVEHNQRWLPGGGQPPQQRADLHGRGVVGVLGRVQPAGVHRGGPGVPGEAQLADPLERPAGHDRLARRMPGRVIVEAALGRALSVAARPGGDVHRVDRLPTGQRVAGQQPAQPLRVDPPAGQRGVGAAPAAPVRGFQAQVRQGRDRPLGAQQRVGQVHQGVGAVGAAGVQLGAEGLQACQRHRRVGVGGRRGWVHTPGRGHRRLLRDLLLFCPKDHTVAASRHQPAPTAGIKG
jgi:hypothetical protein